MEPSECTGHSHDHLDHDDGLGLSLRPLINFLGVSCLNEVIPNSGQSILKLHEERLTSIPNLISQDDDPELLLYIPFTEAVTIQFISIGCIQLQSTPTVASPRHIKLFVNRDNLDFTTAHDLIADTELEILPPYHFANGTIDYPLRPAGRFQNISSLTIFVVTNYGSSNENNNENENDEISTMITYVGLKGKGSKQKRQAVETVYESRGVPKDHKVKNGEFGNSHIL